MGCTSETISTSSGPSFANARHAATSATESKVPWSSPVASRSRCSRPEGQACPGAPPIGHTTVWRSAHIAPHSRPRRHNPYTNFSRAVGHTFSWRRLCVTGGPPGWRRSSGSGMHRLARDRRTIRTAPSRAAPTTAPVRARCGRHGIPRTRGCRQPAAAARTGRIGPRRAGRGIGACSWRARCGGGPRRPCRRRGHLRPWPSHSVGDRPRASSRHKRRTASAQARAGPCRKRGRGQPQVAPQSAVCSARAQGRAPSRDLCGASCRPPAASRRRRGLKSASSQCMARRGCDRAPADGRRTAGIDRARAAWRCGGGSARGRAHARPRGLGRPCRAPWDRVVRRMAARAPGSDALAGSPSAMPAAGEQAAGPRTHMFHETYGV